MRTLWKITQILGEPGWTRSCQVLMDVYKFMPCIWRSHFGVVSAVSAMRVCVGARTLLHLLDTMWRNAPAGHISPETLQLQGHKTNTLSPFLWRRFKTSMRNLIQHNTTWYNMIQHLYIIWFTLGACCFLVCVDMFPSMACTHNASPFSGRHPNYALIGNYMKLYWPESSPKSARLRRKSNSKLQTPLWRQSFVSQMSSKIHMWLGFQWSLDHINVHSHTSLLRNLKKGENKAKQNLWLCKARVAHSSKWESNSNFPFMFWCPEILSRAQLVRAVSSISRVLSRMHTNSDSFQSYWYALQVSIPRF